MSLTCFAYACEHKFDHRQVGKKRIFHRLPKNVKLAKEWLRLSRANADLKQFGSIRLCSDHFHPSQYHGTHLIKDAVPSIFSWSNGSKDSEESVVPSSTVESNVPFGTHDEEVSVLTIEPSCTDVEQANGYRTNLTSPSIIPSQTNERFLSTIIDMNTICRLCYKDFKDVLMSKDVDDSLNASLKFKVQKLLPFIDLDDNSPKHICIDCVNIINSFHHLMETSREREAYKKKSLLFRDIKNKLNVDQENNKRLDLSPDENNINSTSIELVTQSLTLHIGVQNTSETVLSDTNVKDTPEVLCSETMDTMEASDVTSEHSVEQLKIHLTHKFPTANSKLKVQNSGKISSTRLHDILGKIAHRVDRSEPSQEEAEGKEKDDNQDSVENNPNLRDNPMQPSLSKNHDHVLDNNNQLMPIVIDNEHNTNEHTIEQTYAMWQVEKKATNLSNTTVATQPSFSCNTCPASYVSRNLLTKHQKVMHPVSHPCLKCETCSSSFLHIFDLIMHCCKYYHRKLRVDNGDGSFRYQCDLCPYYSPGTKYHLSVFKKHYDTHTTTDVNNVEYQHRPYKCTLCDKTYINYRTLRSHQVIHMDRPFECNFCGKKFLYKCKVAEHIRFVHKREWNYRCPDCNKPFPTASKMKIHMARHMSDYKHVCNLCNKRFFSMHWLMEHNKLYHPKPNPKSRAKFFCTLCNKAYVLKKSLDKHCRKVHIHDLILPGGDLPQSSSLPPTTLQSVEGDLSLSR